MSEYLPQIIQQGFNGLSLGAIYALIAIGYTMVYGIIGMINFAHGEIYMIGAYVGLVTLTAEGTQGSVPLPLLIGLMLVAAMAVTALYGYSVVRIAYRPVRGGPRLVALISAIGMSIFLQNWVALGQGSRDMAVPTLIAGGIDYGKADQPGDENRGVFGAHGHEFTLEQRVSACWTPIRSRDAPFCIHQETSPFRCRQPAVRA